jgi:hypothetical protein
VGTKAGGGDMIVSSMTLPRCMRCKLPRARVVRFLAWYARHDGTYNNNRGSRRFVHLCRACLDDLSLELDP